jgi:hypothetical protein
MQRLTPLLAAHGASWSQLPDVVSARAEAFELDARFGALDERGVFNALDAAGALRHRVGDLDIEGAMESPPPDTRAWVRGNAIRRLNAKRTPYLARWTGIHDVDGRQELDLADPLETEERWRACSPGGSLLKEIFR